MKQSKRQQRLERKRLELFVCMTEKNYKNKPGELNQSMGRPIECVEDIKDMFYYMEKMHNMQTDKSEMERLIKIFTNNPKECNHLVFNAYREKDYIQWVCKFISDKQVKFMSEKNYL